MFIKINKIVILIMTFIQKLVLNIPSIKVFIFPPVKQYYIRYPRVATCTYKLMVTFMWTFAH